MGANLTEKLERCSAPDRQLDEAVAEALGGTVRRVSRLTLNGRSPGSWRVFWPGKDNNGRGSAIPYYTKNEASRQRAIKRLRDTEDQP